MIEKNESDHPTVSLLTLETPLHPLKRLGDALGIDLWIKRDDLGEIGGGGNKLRKLQYLLGAAQARGNDVIVTAGSVQSNHCRLTAAAATQRGLGCYLVLTQPFDNAASFYMQSGNRALFDLFGADTTTVDFGQESADTIQQVFVDLSARGHNPMIIPVGGSTPLGCLGYVDASAEIARQLESRNKRVFDVTICASGSGGMHAGLVVGNTRDGFTKRIIGASVGRTQKEQTDVVSKLVNETQFLLGDTLDHSSVEVSDCARGPGYGQIDHDSITALTMAAQSEGLLLDPVYTGKAFAGLVTLVKNGTIQRGCRVLFIHSGGAPALFAYPEAVVAGTRHVL